MTTVFACGCTIVRRDDGALISATPCKQHEQLGRDKPLVDALESPHIAVSVGDKVDVKSLFGGRP